MTTARLQAAMDDESTAISDGDARARIIRVLIVDDCHAVTNGLESILRAYADIEVVGQAATGLEAVARAEELRPDVILMDAQMPGMDGVEATPRVKLRSPSSRVLFMAVHPTDIDAALDAGADGWLMKDSGRQELVEAIRILAAPR